MNTDFRKDLERTPERRAKTKKIAKFKGDFRVKPFNEGQRVAAVGKARELT